MPKNEETKNQAEGMRLDKFLKVSRIIKRRSVANDACDTEHVSLNGRPAKPGAKLKIGDVISVRYGENVTDYEVVSLNEHARKDEADGMYRIKR
jgi:ribosomal 50S subunit-recycling heat shock protein